MAKYNTPNCPICLRKTIRPVHTNSCLHGLCYKFIHRWSQHKSNCPLCLRNFSCIIIRKKRLRKQKKPIRNVRSVKISKKIKRVTQRQQAKKWDLNMCVQDEILRAFEKPNTRSNSQKILGVISMIQSLILEI